MFRVQYPWFGGPGVLRVADASLLRSGEHDVLVRAIREIRDRFARTIG